MERFGTLENYSAFKFESYLHKLKQKIKYGRLPLQQVVSRIAEESSSFSGNQNIKPDVTLKKIITRQNNRSYYSQMYLKTTCFFNYGKRNQFCGMNDGRIIEIRNIIQDDITKKNFIEGHEFKEIGNFFTYPLLSSTAGVYTLSKSSTSLHSWSIEHVKEKYFCMPCNERKLVAIKMLHFT